MNLTHLRNFSPFNDSSTKSTFPLQNESLSSSSISSFSSDIITDHHFNISNGNQTYNIRKLKLLVTPCKISQNSLFEKVLLTLDYLSSDLNDSSLIDFCEFLSCCYKIIPQEVISRIISIFQNNQFSTNSLIAISYFIKDFQDNPFDEDSIQFFQNFINKSFLQLRKELLSSTINSPNNTVSDNFLTNNSFHNLEKFNNCCTFWIFDSQMLNPDTYFNEDDYFEISNVDDNSLISNNHNYDNVIIYENDEKSNNNNNPNCRFTQNNTQNNSFITSNNNKNKENNNSNNNNQNSNCQKVYKLFNCTFTHTQILRFLLYFLRSKEMREINPMCNSWIDFAQILVSQYENQSELAQFANYMISTGNINLVPKEMFMNTNFLELAEKKNALEVIKILSADDINNNELLIGMMLNRFPDSEFTFTFLKKCQEIDYTLGFSFLKESALASGNFLLNENEVDNLDLTDIVNRIDPVEFNESFLNYLARYKFKLNQSISLEISKILNNGCHYPKVPIEYLIRIMDSPLNFIDYKYLIPYLYSCTNIDVFNSITDNYPLKQKNEVIIHPIFKDPKFWSQLISVFEFNSIQYFIKIFISNNSDNRCGSLVAKIFLDEFPKNMKSSFYFFAKNVLKNHRDSFSTCNETNELLNRFDFIYPKQFWRLFSKPNLIINLVHSNRGKPFYYHFLLSFTFVQISLMEENGMTPPDPMIRELSLPVPLTSNLVEEITTFFNDSKDYFKIENTSNEVIQIISVSHYYYSTLIFHYSQLYISGLSPLYCLIMLIVIINDMKHFNILFCQLKSQFNMLLNTQNFLILIKQAFEMDFPGKEQLIDTFLSSFGSSDDENYVLSINDNDLRWIQVIFDNNSIFTTNSAYSNSLSYFFGQLTLCVNAFNCPITNKFLLSKIDYLLQMFYLYPCPFFTINSEILENFIRRQIFNYKMSFRLINFVMSSISPLSHSFVFPEFDLHAIASPFFNQNQISDISIVFDFCRLYMPSEKSVNLLKSQFLPNISKVSYKWLFQLLSNKDFREIYTIDCIKDLVHTAEFSFFDGIIRAVEGILDDDETISNRCTYIAQNKKKVFSIGENFQFSSRLALYPKRYKSSSYHPNFLYGLYRVYEDSFVDYHNHILIERIDFVPLNKNSEYSINLLNELIKDAIQTNSWQMFYLLKSIANTHLFLFTNNDESNSFDLIEIFKYCVNSICSLNYHNFNDSFKLFLACHAFLSFLTLSPCIADSFFNWVFTQFNEFSDNEFYYILTFINNFLNFQTTKTQMLAFCIKYDCVALIIKHLQILKSPKDKSKESMKASSMTHSETKSSLNANKNNNNNSQTQSDIRNVSNNDFNDQILYIDYDLFSETENESDNDADTFLSSIRLDTDSNDNERSNNNSEYQCANPNIDSNSTSNENNNEINNEGIIRCAHKIKKSTCCLGMSIVKTIESSISLLSSKKNYLKLIELDEMLKNTSPNPVYKGSYNDCLNFSPFKPFSNSFPREISIPNLQPKSFYNNLVELRSSLADSDYVNSFTQSKLLGEIDSGETTIQLNFLKDPYVRGQINFNLPVDPTNNNTFNNFNQWNEMSIRTPLLKEIISIDPDEYDFMDEGGQTALLRQQLPPLPNITDSYVHRFLTRMPSWASVILSNSPVRAILPPRYLIELHRIIFLINQLKMDLSTKQNIKNSDFLIDIDQSKYIFDLQDKNGIIELKLNFIANLMKEKMYVPIKSMKRFCSIFFTIASSCSEEFVKKVFTIGNKYISINSDMGVVTGIFCAFESMKSSTYFATNFNSMSALNVYETFGRSCISNPEITVLTCSLFSATGNSITEFGIQVFEISLEMKDQKVYECLEYIAQLPDKVKQRLTKYVCNLIDNKALIFNLNNYLTNNQNLSTKLNQEEIKNSQTNNTVSLIEKIVQNFPSIVESRSSKFIEILACILGKGKYLPVVGMIASILCPGKASQNKIKTSQSMPQTSVSSTSNSTPALASTSSLPTPSSTSALTSLTISAPPNPIMTNAPSAAKASECSTRLNQSPAPNADQDFDSLSISLNKNDDDDYLLSFGVPNHVFRTYPEFWKVIGPSMPMFNKMIEDDLKTLRFELSFLMNYPEVLSFTCKLLLFHKAQYIQQVKQQQRLQREYHNRGGILTFNSVIMTINNSNSSNSTNSTNNNNNNSSARAASANNISFINSSTMMSNSSNNNNNSARNLQGSTRRVISRTNNSLISFVNDSQPQRMPQQQSNSRSHPRVSNRTNSNSNINSSENHDSQNNNGIINGGIIRPMIKVRRSHILPDTYNVFGPSFSDLGFNIMPIRDIFVRFVGEPGIDLGGLTKDWISSTIKELFNQDYGLFKQTTDGFSLFPNPTSSVNPEHLGYFELAGRIIAISLAKDVNIDAHLAHPFLKIILERKPNISDLEKIDKQIFNSLKWISSNKNVEDLDIYFVVDVETSLGIKETVDLVKNGRNIKVTDSNKKFFIASMANYYLHSSVEAQIKAFKKGFYSIILPQFIRMFTPTELDLLISGTNFIDIDDMRQNCSYEKPYHKNHQVIKLFFSCISKWNQEELHLLLRFITGLAHVPIGGFASLAEKKKPLTISPGGDRERLPQAHTCFNRIDIPAYQNEKELNEKLLLSIHECDNFLLI